MELIRGLHNLKTSHKRCVATIGNFDGLHRGHQYLLTQLKKKSLELSLPTTLITFEPHPKEYFAPELAPGRLTRLREKLLLLEEIGIDRVLVIRFNESFAGLSAEAFIQKIIIKGLEIKCLIIGDDFHFGYNRKGDCKLLREYASHYKFNVMTVTPQVIDGTRISSSAVRTALQQGDLNFAERLLGRLYGIYGRIVHGDKRGRMVGFPTANIYLHRKVSPLQGVYAIKLYGLGVAPLYGVCNLGNRPTVDGTKALLEVHLFNFDEQVYGSYVRVDFYYKLREEKKFPSIDALKKQIFKDAEEAKSYFGI